MKSTFFAATFVALIANCGAAPTPNRGERVDGEAILPIHIGLTQNGLENGEIHLMEVSHPSSPNFGKHWTQEQVHDMFAPSEEAVQSVRDWLVAAGIEDDAIVHSDNKGWLAFDIPAWQAEDLFQTEYHEHVHSTSGQVRVGCDEYSLPSHLRDHVDYILPGVKFSASLRKTEVKRSAVKRTSHNHLGPKKSPWNPYPWSIPSGARKLPPDLQNCGVNITPVYIKALYQIPTAHLKDNVNQMGLYESGDAYSQEDLNNFFAAYAPDVPQGTHPTLDSIDGGVAPEPVTSQFVTGESDIDMDLAFSLIYPQTITLYQVDDFAEAFTDGGFNTFLDALNGSYCTYTAYGITGDSPGVDAVYPDPAAGGYKGPLACGTYKPTRVISVSYGVSEFDAPVNYTRRQCNEFLKLGLQGHTIMYASGNYGVASFPGDDSANGCLGNDSTIYSPSFPTCPWVLNVGATRLYDDQTVNDPESAMQANLGPSTELFSSAGGFANYFPVPDYQKLAVSEYFAFHEPGLPYYYANDQATNIGANGGFYNRAGRGFPDVSANGANLLAFVGGALGQWYGTSLAAPIWGSAITLLNEERTVAGKGPVGFVNPVLYANPWALNDIKNGSNPGCGSKGFSAVSGWDPVTGLGTPSYPRLLELFLSLP